MTFWPFCPYKGCMGLRLYRYLFPRRARPTWMCKTHRDNLTQIHHALKKWVADEETII